MRLSVYLTTLGAFVKTRLLRKLLDSKQGLLLAVVNAQYTFNKYAALWALKRNCLEVNRDQQAIYPGRSIP